LAICGIAVDENIIKALVGIAGAIAGALLVAATNAYTANRKIKEVELAYLYKLRDGYLENARKLSEQVYIPINILLTRLAAAYDNLRANTDSKVKLLQSEPRTHFLGLHVVT
jgi:hypothetical protein